MCGLPDIAIIYMSQLNSADLQEKGGGLAYVGRPAGWDICHIARTQSCAPEVNSELTAIYSFREPQRALMRRRRICAS